MLALYRSGRQAEALEAITRPAAALVDELGIEPGPELQQLYARSCARSGCSPRCRRARRIEDHYDEVVSALLAGRLVPVLGTGVNRDGATPGRDELAGYLADSFDFRRRRPRPRAGRAVRRGDERRRPAVRRAARAARPRFRRRAGAPLRSPRCRRAARAGAPHQLIVTTSFDLALERAFADAGRGVRRRLVRRARAATAASSCTLARRRGAVSTSRTPTPGSRWTSAPSS